MMIRNTQLDELIELLINIKNKKEMGDFLLELISPKELEEIPTRLQIVKLLKKGISQHKIAEGLGIGVATVTRGSKEIQNGRFKNI